MTLAAALPMFSGTDAGIFALPMMIIAGLVMLGVLVVVHEFGHFVVAKMFGVGVPIFSVGMGPRLFGFWFRGTDYRISLLPLGGYVRLSGADPFGEEDPDAIVDPDQDFMHKPVWQRLLVMLAGPGFNLALPFILFTGVLMLGEPQVDGVVGMVRPGSAADLGGIRPGDRLVAVDEQPVELWIDAYDAIGRAPRDARLTIERAGEPFTIPFTTADMTEAPGIPQDVFTALGFVPSRLSTRLGVDDPTSPAARAGLRTGDAITAVDGVDVASWDQLAAALTAQTHTVQYLRIETDGTLATRTATLLADPIWTPRAEEPLPNTFGLIPAAMFVGSTPVGSPAQMAGLKPDDRLLAVDGQPLRSWDDLVRGVAKTVDVATEDATPRPVTLTVVRDGARIDLNFTPKMDRTPELGHVRWRPIMGIRQYPDGMIEGVKVPKYYGLFEAFGRAAQDTWFLVTATFTMLGSLFTGETRIGDTLGGPIEIFRLAQKGAERGLHTYVRLIGQISISLGIFNLLPVPVLDGGQIVFFTVEGLRGRPLSIQLREKLQMAGVLALVALMLVVGVLDIGRMMSAE